MEFERGYAFNLPKANQSIIKVIGVGGGGSNAVNHMYNEGIKDVEFIVVNTDSQALQSSPVPSKLQIGVNLTEGLGAGANPERGRNAAIESKEEIRELLSHNTKMVFITAGMGGGTGTGAAPVIARIAKDLGILTVGIVTTPFEWEGKKKKAQADIGLEELKANCDTVLVILNDRLFEIFGQLTLRQAFAEADNILTTAAKSIAEIITVNTDVNVDFEDVKTVMKDSGAAVMGSASTSGEGRALRAAQEVLSSPLLNNTDINGAQKILLSIMYGEDEQLRMDELNQITQYIEEQSGGDADIIFGSGCDSTLGSHVRVTLIATGFQLSAGSRQEKVHIALNSGKQTSLFPSVEPPATGPRTMDLFPTNTGPAREQEKLRTPSPAPELIPLEGKYEVTFVNKAEEPKPVVEKKEPLAEKDKAEDLRQQRIKMSKEYSDRIRKLYQLSASHEGALDELYKVPAYQRNQTSLDDVPNPDDHETSRYNLNEDKGLLGNNRFLHDNVD
jgi:cell division protein FtsZ